MDNLLDDIVTVSRRCKRASKLFEKEILKEKKGKIIEAFKIANEASSKSWLGYQAGFYIVGFRKPYPYEVFDIQHGLEGVPWNRTFGDWREYTYDEVADFMFGHAGIADFEMFKEAAGVAREAIEEGKRELLTTLDVILKSDDDANLRDIRARIAALATSHSQQSFAETMKPKNQMVLNDYRAINGGSSCPHHVAVSCYLFHLASHGLQAQHLANEADTLRSYLEKSLKMKGTSVAKTDGKVFIGHGGSKEWLVLNNFLRDILGLETIEFNSESTAGKAIQTRLSAMLDEACFAFIMMTAEDEQPDGKIRARENVVHEAGLFQGRLGWEKAIVLLEDGCNEFSNMHGIGEIRFPKDNIMAKTEEIRKVLQREKILKS